VQSAVCLLLQKRKLGSLLEKSAATFVFAFSLHSKVQAVLRRSVPCVKRRICSKISENIKMRERRKTFFDTCCNLTAEKATKSQPITSVITYCVG